MRVLLILFLLLTFSGPLYLAVTGAIDFSLDFRTANRESAKLAPDAVKSRDAVVQVYSARTFNWRGLFAVHTWIAVKPKNDQQYHVYQVVGWRLLHKLPLVMAEVDIPDRNWFAQTPQILLDIRGAEAEKIIPQIQQAIKTYPYPNQYVYWPGPNSNTFTAYIAQQVPAMKLALPSNAVGKDFLPPRTFFTTAPSGTGYQLSYDGIIGLIFARKEGIEVNILGLVYGIGFDPLCLKLPGWGDIRLRTKPTTK